jgi:hypothetical protein
MSKAFTQDLHITVRIASFQPLRDDTYKRILHEVGETMQKIGKDKNFLVWTTAIEKPNMESHDD